ncbi:MAG: serine hydrolase [Flavobacteriales bacterium]|nr:serine hydrolase [Flavobacteriales bacterium]
MRNLFILPSVVLLLSGTLDGSAQTTYFPPLVGSTWQTSDPAALGWCTDQLLPLHDFLATSNSKAFIVLKDGRIAIEWYYGSFTQDSLWYWASAGKSVTAFLVGKAQEEGFLSISDSTSHYLGAGWTSCTPAQEGAITVRDQLAMISGLDDGVPDLDCTDPICLNYLADPGTRWAYHNAPYTLLDGVIANATGQTLNAYLNAKLNATIGLGGLYFPIGSNNVLISKPRGMARFGLMMMAGGSWNGSPIMSDAAYFQDMITPSQSLNNAYGYLWWLNGQSSYMLPGFQLVLPGPLMPNAPLDAFNAMGRNGQVINVSPSQGLVVVRMGDLPGGIFVPNVYNDQIWQYLNAVICAGTGVDEQLLGGLELFPNPATDLVDVHLSGAHGPGVLTIADGLGRIMRSERLTGDHLQIDVSGLPGGCYMVSFRGERAVFTGRFVKQQ